MQIPRETREGFLKDQGRPTLICKNVVGVFAAFLDFCCYFCFRSSREMRNLAEKKRRDTLNTHINELSTLVPMVARSSKKMDKTSVLRLSATYLRMNKSMFPIHFYVLRSFFKPWALCILSEAE